MKITLLFFLLILNFNLQAATLAPFETDKCSKFPDGTREESDLWASCCMKHDVHYWMGGTRKERKRADQELKMCVKLKHEDFIAWLMYSGVRIGGMPVLNTKWKWGFGWDGKRRFFRLSWVDKKKVLKELRSSDQISNANKKSIITSRRLNKRF